MARKKIIKSHLLSACDISPEQFKTDSFMLLIFGGAGDLSKRKLLPALYHLFKQGYIKEFTILSLGRRNFSNTEYRDLIKVALKEFAPNEFKNKLWQQFAKHLVYKSFDVEEQDNYQLICKEINQNVGASRL